MVIITREVILSTNARGMAAPGRPCNVLELVIQVELKLTTFISSSIIARCSKWHSIVDRQRAKWEIEAEAQAGIMVVAIAKFPGVYVDGSQIIENGSPDTLDKREGILSRSVKRTITTEHLGRYRITGADVTVFEATQVVWATEKLAVEYGNCG